MDIEELIEYRKNLLEDSKDEDGFPVTSNLLNEVLPSMLEAKLIDSDEFNDCFYKDPNENLIISAYIVNESGERLQLFLLDEKSVHSDDDLEISSKSYYEAHFKRVYRFLNKSIEGKLNNEFQESSPVKVLISKISSTEGIEQFDVIEIFLISLKATVSFKSKQHLPRKIHFDDQVLETKYTIEKKTKKKKILVLRRLIDLNFLFNVQISRGKREPLKIYFDKTFNYPIEVIKAADEKNFESYLCVLPGNIIADLYKQYSTRLLEKNVRSFLQFKGVNKGIRRTIRIEPEKFIAYNNGLTITATEATLITSKKKTYITSLKDFQIVNGGQTTATIYFTRKDGIDISRIKVMAKINVAKQSTESQLEELISSISEYSNAQSRVSKVDLRSRNPQLIKLKQLSDSVITPSGNKWFFERAKGEYHTKLRKLGSKKSVLKREYPQQRRFSKEQLAKYYLSWGDEPFKVKKGGEKIFRDFVEKIDPGDAELNENKKKVIIDRDFYEKVISKIILFRSLEKIYGQGKNSIGQLRSSVIPYSISVLYTYSDGKFDFLKIWRQQELDTDLVVFFKELMRLMNELIKFFSTSEDYGENAKKQELWERIKKSRELKEFINTEMYLEILIKYTL